MAASLKIPVSIPRTFRFQRSSGRRLLPALLIIAALAFPLWHLHEMNRDFHLPPTHNDLISRWAGTRAALQGQDPYSPGVTQQIEAVADHDSTEAFAYPAYFVVLLAPFASLSWKTFSLIYLIGVVIPALLLGFWLSTRLLHLPITREKSALVAVLALSSWPPPSSSSPAFCSAATMASPPDSSWPSPPSSRSSRSPSSSGSRSGPASTGAGPSLRPSPSPWLSCCPQRK
jgi:hypothetical protein